MMRRRHRSGVLLRGFRFVQRRQIEFGLEGLARLEAELVRGHVGESAPDHVAAGVPVEGVVAEAADDDIVSRQAEDLIVAVLAEDRVRAQITANRGPAPHHRRWY